MRHIRTQRVSFANTRRWILWCVCIFHKINAITFYFKRRTMRVSVEISKKWVFARTSATFTECVTRGETFEKTDKKMNLWRIQQQNIIDEGATATTPIQDPIISTAFVSSSYQCHRINWDICREFIVYQFITSNTITRHMRHTREHHRHRIDSNSNKKATQLRQ